jgi:hypothetical protein
VWKARALYLELACVTNCAREPTWVLAFYDALAGDRPVDFTREFVDAEIHVPAH